MAIHEDVEVKVTLRPPKEELPEESPFPMPRGEAYTEYPERTPRPHFPGVMKYIKAVSSQEFQIEVYLQSTFDMFDADDLKVFLSIDNGTVSFGIIITKPEVLYRLTTGSPIIIRDMIDINEAGEYCRHSFSFASLEGGE